MANVTFTFNPVPAPACYPPDINGLAQELTTGGVLSGTIPDTAGGGIFVGSAAPSSSLTNKVWFKVDAAGRPLGIYEFYNGNWRKVYTGVALGEIRMFAGIYSTNFDGSGLGLVGGDLDGWALCNGHNGTPNLEGLFAASGAPGQQVGQATDQWFTTTEGAGWKLSGGAVGPHTISGSNLPQLHTQISAHSATVQAGGGHTDTWLSAAGADTTLPGYPVTETIGSPNTPMPFPPYIAVGFIQFVGYQ